MAVQLALVEVEVQVDLELHLLIELPVRHVQMATGIVIAAEQEEQEEVPEMVAVEVMELRETVLKYILMVLHQFLCKVDL
jgi:hypothetical protein